MFDVRPGSAAPLVSFVVVNGLLVSTLASLVADPRVMQVRASALSRTAEMMATVNRVAQPDDPWTSGQGLIYRSGEMVPGEAVPPEHQANPSNVASAIMPPWV